MKREARDIRDRMPRPVQRIALEEHPSRRRILWIILSLAVAAGAFFAFFQGLLRVDPGWQEIPSEGKYASLISLRYPLGQTGEATASEKKKLQRLFTLAVDQAGQALDSSEIIAEPGNLAWLNAHPNQTAEVSPALYRALEKAFSAGRAVFFGPLYEMNESLLASGTDADAEQMDPRRSPEAAEYVEALLPLLSSPEHIRLELLGENRLTLFVSEEYHRLGEEYGISRWIDFGWMRNAFAADLVAEALLEAGVSRGLISAAMPDLSGKSGRSSGALFLRSLGENDGIRFSLTARQTADSAPAASAEFQESSAEGIPSGSSPSSSAVRTLSPGETAEAICRKPAALISLNALQSGRLYADGELRTPWISPASGLDAHGADALLAASPRDGCAELLLRLLPLLTGEEKEPSGLPEESAVWLLENQTLFQFGSASLLEE